MRKVEKTIEAFIQELEPNKSYVIFIDKRFIDYLDRDYLAKSLEKLGPHSGVAVVGGGDPEKMVCVENHHDYGEIVVRLKDYAHSVIWHPMDVKDFSIENLDIPHWGKSVIKQFAAKVHETMIALKAEQDRRKYKKAKQTEDTVNGPDA